MMSDFYEILTNLESFSRTDHSVLGKSYLDQNLFPAGKYEFFGRIPLAKLITDTYAKLGLVVKEFKDTELYKEYLQKAMIVTRSYWSKQLMNRSA